MKTKILLAIIILSSCQTSNSYIHEETPTDHEERMAWWRDSRMGLFIHWGLYSIPAGQWKNETFHAEDIRLTAKIPTKEYHQLIKQFSPEKFSAKEWVKLAKNAGMKYIILTVKHHDGFCLWDSKQTDFDVMSCREQVDVLKELSEVCAREDIRLGIFYSITDWNNPNFIPGLSWDRNNSSKNADFSRYVSYMKRQLRELLTNYGPIDILWFDGGFTSEWSADLGKDLYNYVRSLQPQIIINDRVTPPPQPVSQTAYPYFAGDFSTTEYADSVIPIGQDWEMCMKMNNHWGYNRHDTDYKGYVGLIYHLVQTASKGGNLLLNIGASPDGIFPTESVDALRNIGTWMNVNGESIYGTKRNPLSDQDWGFITYKPMENSSRLYLHIFEWPNNKQIQIKGLKNQIIRAFILSDPDQYELNINTDNGVSILLPNQPSDPVNTVIALDIIGHPEIN